MLDLRKTIGGACATLQLPLAADVERWRSANVYWFSSGKFIGNHAVRRINSACGTLMVCCRKAPLP